MGACLPLFDAVRLFGQRLIILPGGDLEQAVLLQAEEVLVFRCMGFGPFFKSRQAHHRAVDPLQIGVKEAEFQQLTLMVEKAVGVFTREFGEPFQDETGLQNRDRLYRKALVHLRGLLLVEAEHRLGEGILGRLIFQ